MTSDSSAATPTTAQRVTALTRAFAVNRRARARPTPTGRLEPVRRESAA